MRSRHELDHVVIFTGDEHIANAARQWIAEAEAEAVEEGMTDPIGLEPLEYGEKEAYAMDAANVRIYIDLCYPGGCDAFIQDHAE
jgi:hypothetical protein